MTGVQTCALPISLSSSSEMKLATANAIASLVSDEELNENNILPEAFDSRVADVVSKAVKELI